MKKKDFRSSRRYNEKGRVDAMEICALPGVLDDISETGCRVRFPNPCSIDAENEYMLTLRPARQNIASRIDLVCQPQWQRTGDDQTEIGFSFVSSPDYPELVKFIGVLDENSGNDSDITDMIIDSDAVFIG